MGCEMKLRNADVLYLLKLLFKVVNECRAIFNNWDQLNQNH